MKFLTTEDIVTSWEKGNKAAQVEQNTPSSQISKMMEHLSDEEPIGNGSNETAKAHVLRNLSPEIEKELDEVLIKHGLNS